MCEPDLPWTVREGFVLCLLMPCTHLWSAREPIPTTNPYQTTEITKKKVMNLSTSCCPTYTRFAFCSSKIPTLYGSERVAHWMFDTPPSLLSLSVCGRYRSHMYSRLKTYLYNSNLFEYHLKLNMCLSFHETENCYSIQTR